ncbi:MAG: helix-turn-helix transcriptional regulator [Nocardioidaceae bacterium]
MPRRSDDAYEHTLGGKLRAARHQAGLSQSALETRSGVPKARLSRYENNHVVPSLRLFVQLCSALRITPGSILDGPDAPRLT